MAKETGMTVLGLKYQDVRNISLVDVELAGRTFVEARGANGAGKSTLIEGIFLALAGTKYLGKGFPGWRVIKSGKDKALLKVTVGGVGREIEVRRSITKIERPDGTTDTGGSVKIVDSNGEKLGQSFLDGLIDEFTVDPVSFARKPAKEQGEIIQRLAGIDPEANDERRQALREERRDASRQVRQGKGKVEQLEQGARDVEPVDVDELAQELQAVEQRNASRREKAREADALQVTAETAQEKAEAIGRDIERLERELSDQRDALKKAKAAAKKLVAEAEASVDAVEAEESTEHIRVAMSEAQERNRQAYQWRDLQQALRELSAAEEAHEKAQAKLAEIDEEEREALAGANLPFDSVEYDSELGLVIRGVPFSQFSDGEKIAISTRIGMAVPGKLRLVCIKDGSLMDERSLARVRELAAEHGFQVIVERVGEDGDGADSIVMRSGNIVSQFEDEKRERLL